VDFKGREPAPDASAHGQPIHQLDDADSPPEVLLANVRWLVGYRHPRHDVPVAETLRAVFSRPMPLLDGAEAAGEPIAVLPVLFHLLWRRELVADLSVPLTVETEVSAALACTAREAAT
jgi:hypothetical protein